LRRGDNAKIHAAPSAQAFEGILFLAGAQSVGKQRGAVFRFFKRS